MVLGLKSHFTKFEAREALEREIAKLTGQSTGGRVVNDASVTFGWFVRNRFLPPKEAQWKKETARVKTLLIQQDLIENSRRSHWKTSTNSLCKFTSTS
jgi:hypothetical protein